MTLKFITGNKNKFEEGKRILEGILISQADIDLTEIQELDAKKVIESKLLEAKKYMNENDKYFCEDTSLSILSMNGFPGPLIKWYLECLGCEGIYKQVESTGDTRAVAKTIVGYYDNRNIMFFEGEINGNIVMPIGENNFGWNAIFKPEGSDKTFAQMSLEEKNQFSMRQIAFNKLKEYIENFEKQRQF